MQKKKKIFDIEIDEKLLNFINNLVLNDLNINNNFFWEGCSNLINELNPKNKKLIIIERFFKKKLIFGIKKILERK